MMHFTVSQEQLSRQSDELKVAFRKVSLVLSYEADLDTDCLTYVKWS